jgi:hypothetical protein
MKNIILIVFCFCMISCQKENQSIDNNLLKKENTLLQKKNDSLKERVKIAEEAITILQRDVWYDPENDNTDFKKEGIVDSENFIIDELMKRPELIPLKSTLGGKMSFSNIKLLGSKYLIAFYEDGHVEGKSIYSYKLTGSNNLEFKIVVSE